MKNIAASREAANPDPVKSFAASGGGFDPNTTVMRSTYATLAGDSPSTQ